MHNSIKLMSKWKQWVILLLLGWFLLHNYVLQLEDYNYTIDTAV